MLVPTIRVQKAGTPRRWRDSVDTAGLGIGLMLLPMLLVRMTLRENRSAFFIAVVVGLSIVAVGCLVQVFLVFGAAGRRARRAALASPAGWSVRMHISRNDLAYLLKAEHRPKEARGAYGRTQDDQGLPCFLVNNDDGLTVWYPRALHYKILPLPATGVELHFNDDDQLHTIQITGRKVASFPAQDLSPPEN